MSNRILVVNGLEYRNVAEGLGDITGKPSEFYANPNDFKLVLFTGGSDVSPALYGDISPKNICSCSPSRDKQEVAIFEKALKHNIKMTGICRGFQFLNVMAGGRMMHHISGHGGSTHIMDTPTGHKLFVNSYHHQMILPAPGTKIVGWSGEILSKSYIGTSDEYVSYYGKENEAAIFTRIGGFGVQYHPETLSKEYEAYDYYRRMIINALDLKWETFIVAYTKGLSDVKLLDVYGHSNTASG